MSLDPHLLEILACPACKQELVYFEADEALVCRSCRLRYRIDEGIPVMLVEEAESLSDDAFARVEERGRELGLIGDG